MNSSPRCSRFQRYVTYFALSLAAVLLAGAASAQVITGDIATPDVGQVAGRPVVIVAQGFLPGESVELQVTHAGGTAEPGMGHDPWTVTAGADGAFATTWVINPPDGQSDVFIVTARGRFSGATSSAIFDRMAAVSTDRFAYVPTEDARIAGSGFLSGEGVTLQVQRSGAAADESAGAAPWTVTADEAGSIASSWFMSADSSFGTDSILTAKGDSSGLTAAWAFTDASCLTAPTPSPTVPLVLPTVACPTNLGSCSANDVVTTVVAASALNGAVCGSRDNTLPLNFTLKFETTANQRYDLGTFIAEDGGSLASGNGSVVARVCGGAAPQVSWGDTNADTSDCDSDVFLDLDSSGHQPDQNAVDTCGDLQASAGPVFWTITANVSCATVDANFHLKVPSCRVWEQNANHTVACTSLSQAGTGSKCDCTDLDFTTVLDPCVTALCDDGNICTVDSCAVENSAAVCHHDPAQSGAVCGDVAVCTGQAQCSGGSCVAGATIDCSDDNPCTDDSCDSATGCVHTDNTASCDDGNVCTTTDTCGGGSCHGGPAPDCDDNNPCTDDSCDPATGCVHTNNTAPCNDGNACTTNDTCGGGTCNGGPAPDCNDNNPCTDDSCNPFALGVPAGCAHTNNTAPCNDENACTTNDTCGGGTCNGGSAPDCNDNNPCTDDSCDAATGCVHTNNTAACDDGNACTTNDTCGGGTCNGGAAPNCNDNNPCTDDSCNPFALGGPAGCVHTNNTAPCDDGNACTTNDTCGGGTCNGGAAPNCNDNNPCTDDSCNPATGCVHTNNTAPCDDGNACTTNDTCGGGTCNGGPAPNCNDNNPCTDDSCNAATGCVHTNNTAPCDDGNACTTSDTCGGGTCNGGAAPNCNDNNPCTDDSCDPATGCVHTNNTAPCNDGSACTTGDTCGGGTCSGGPAPNCNDNNLCTNDSCNPATGCVHTNNTASCDDGNACTTNDTCGGGKCNPGGPTNCDDGNCCTVDSCNPASGCFHTANTTAPVFTNQPTLGDTVLWPPNHGYADITVSGTGATASSSCGIASVRFASCSSSQPENGTGVGDGNSTRDCVYEPGALHLRAERDGACSPIGRVYETTLVATDVCGNTAVSNAVDVVVWHDRGHQPTAGTIVRATHGSNTKDTRAGTNGTYGTSCGSGATLANGTVHDPSDADPEMEISQDASISVSSLKLSKAAGGNVTLSWTAPSHDSSITIGKYHLYRRASASSLWILIAEPASTTNSYLDPVLNDGSAWQYKATAVIK